MGILKKMFHRDLTPEEQEEKSRKEMELMQKCYDAGAEWREKLGVERKVNAVNRFANKYPVSFFAIIFGILGVSLLINILASSGTSLLEKAGNEVADIPVVESSIDKDRKKISDKLYSMAEEMQILATEVDSIIRKGNLTHRDSVAVRDKLLRLQEIERLMGGTPPDNK